MIQAIDQFTLDELASFYQNELKALSKVLEPYKELWSKEIIGNYPQNLTPYPTQWIKAIAKLSHHQMWQLDCGQSIETENTQLNELFLQLKKAQATPKLPNTQQDITYPSWAMQHVTGKKQHEIKKLVAALEKFELLKPGAKLIEIGGGKGHLGRILSLYHGLNTISLDTNIEFQQLGQKRLEKYPHPENAGQLDFLSHTFGDSCEYTQSKEEQLFNDSDLSIGLHTCGALARLHLNKVKADKALINIGCCYQKCKGPNETNLSTFCKQNINLKFGKFALTLATRGHTVIDLEEFNLKKRVKYYRAALQLFINQNTASSNFISVGSSHSRDYKGDFANYALKKLNQVLEGHNFTEDCLNYFYNDKQTQKNLNTIFWANLIRWRFGRALEKYIIFDRALSLVEKNYRALTFEIFDQSISPRNIAIITLNI